MISQLVSVEGTYNLRDLGGMRADGGTIAAGRLFRSDALSALSEAGMGQFAGLGITRVIDLRDDGERERSPDTLPASATLIPHPIFPSASSHVVRGLDIFGLTEVIYLEHADTLATALALLAEQGEEAREAAGATLFHCTAGKDRTGAVAALALTAVGVSRDDVVADYAASEANLRGEWLDTHLAALARLGLELTPATEGLVGRTPPEALERTLVELDRRFGSVRDYLRASGVSDVTLERLHAALVE